VQIRWEKRVDTCLAMLRFALALLIPDAYKIDLLVNDVVLVEAKTVDRLNAMHQAQVLTYLRLSSKEVGLLLNFWACPLQDGGIQRLVRTRK
jgi:GxxExxY protein